jgi:hypothetical protein
MFVKFDCGCVGFRAYDHNFVIKSCDYGDGERLMGFYQREGMADKGFEELGKMETLALIERLDELVVAGQDFETVSQIFKRQMKREGI